VNLLHSMDLTFSPGSRDPYARGRLEFASFYGSHTLPRQSCHLHSLKLNWTFVYNSACEGTIDPTDHSNIQLALPVL